MTWLIRSRRAVVLGLVLVLLAVAGLISSRPRPFLTRMGGWLDVGESPQSVDMVMILNGDLDTRPFQAIDLLRQNLASRVLITSSADADRASEFPRVHEAMRRILNDCGVADEQIEFMDSQCRSTFDEAETLQRYLDEHPGDSVAVVTNDYHTRRTRWVFQQVLGDRRGQLHFVSAPTDEFNVNNWWRHEAGCVAYLSEFPKFAFYQFRYGRGWIWLVAVIGIIAVSLVLWGTRATRITEPAGE